MPPTGIRNRTAAEKNGLLSDTKKAHRFFILPATFAVLLTCAPLSLGEEIDSMAFCGVSEIHRHWHDFKDSIVLQFSECSQSMEAVSKSE